MADPATGNPSAVIQIPETLQVKLHQASGPGDEDGTHQSLEGSHDAHRACDWSDIAKADGCVNDDRIIRAVETFVRTPQIDTPVPVFHDAESNPE